MWRLTGIVYLVSLLLLGVVGAHAADAYDDARLLRWNSAFVAHDRHLDALITDVEADLRSARMHPYAPYVWARAMYADHRLADDWRKHVAPDLVAVLGGFPDQFLAEEASDEARQSRLANDFPTEGKVIWHARVLATWDTDDKVKSARLNLAALADPNEEFHALWDLLEDADDLRSTRQDAEKLLASRPNPDDLFGRVGRAFLVGDSALRTGRKLELADMWLAEHPHDAMALRFKAIQLDSLSRPEEALEAMRASLASFPYYPYRAQQLSNYAVKVLPEADVRSEVAALVRRTSVLEGGALADRVEQLMANAYRVAGDLGAARRILETALGRSPDAVGLNRAMASLEMDSGRVSEAERFATVVSASALPLKADLELSIRIAATRSEPARVAELVALFKQRFGKLTSNAYYESGRLNPDGSPEAIAFAREALAALPNSEWAHRYLISNLVDAGKSRDEQPLVDEWLQRFVIPADNAQRLYFNHLKAVEDHDAAVAGFRAMQDRWGIYDDYWTLLADEESGDPAKLVFWQGVRRAIPDKAFPIRNILEIYDGQRRFDDALQLIDMARGEMAGADAVERADLAYFRCYIVAQMDTPGDQSAVEIYRRARGDCEEAERLGRNHADTRYEIALLSNIHGDTANMVADWEATTRLSPDSDASRDLGFYNSLAKMSNRRVFAGLYDWYKRDPYDGARIADIAVRHAKWGGSRIFAKVLYERLKVVSPDTFRQHEYDYNQLNADFENASDNFVKQYGDRKSISASLRYVAWYDAARLAAQKRSPIVTLDLDTFTKTVTQPDGQRLVQSEDPVTGAVSYRASGNSWRRFHYDPRGNLVNVEVPNGGGVKIGYDDRGQISRIETDSKVLTLEYNDIGKPAVVTLEGVGRIDVRYDKSGEIEKLEPGGGSEVTVKVAGAMTTLLGMINDTGAGEYRDEKRDAEAAKLRDTLDELSDTPDDARLLPTVKAMVPYLEGADGDFDRIERLLLGLAGEMDKKPGEAAEAVSLLGDLYASTFPGGLDQDYWDHWQEALGQFDKAAGPGLARSRQDAAAKPVTLLPDARWLAGSNLSNPGYWARYELADYVPKPLREGLRLRAIQAMSDGRVIVATSAGLFIREKGFWLRYLIDMRAGKLAQAPNSADATALSDVLAIAERPDGGLWLGTADGLVRLSAAGQVEAYYSSAADGLASRRVTQLVPWRNGVLAAGADGLSFFDDAGAHPETAASLGADKVLARQEPAFVAAISADEVMVGANGAVHLLTPHESPRRIADFEGRSAHVSADGQVYLAGLREVFEVTRGADGRLGALRPLGGRQDLQVSQALYGLAEVDVGDGEAPALAILSDLGIGFYHRGYVEHLTLPLSQGPKAALAISAGKGNFWVMSDSGALYAFQQGQVTVDSDGPVQGIVTDPVGRVTYIARQGSVEAMLHDGPPEAQYLFAARVRKMVPVPNGILFNDGSDIMRYHTGDALPEVLFSARNDVEHYRTAEGRGAANDEITGLAVGPDGAIWATTRTSVFRHANGKTTEYSYFLDAAKFPMPASWIAGVYATVDGRVWVIGSDESHIAVDGTNMRGGMAQWNGNGFDLVGGSDDLEGRPWFVTSYTPVAEGRAIVGTTAGMGMHEAGTFSYLEAMKDSSYLALLAAHPNLFLGERGVLIGKEVWLFPTAAGIVGLRNGEWFYPDRLNRLLPDQRLSRYGSRMVHTLETDANGRIYAGTDRGLMVFDTGGGDAADFLTSSGMREQAFERQEEESLRRQREIFIKGLGADDPRARLAKRYLELEDELSKLAVEQRVRGESALTEKLAAKPPASAGPDDGLIASHESADRIRDLVEQRQKQMARVLLQLERDSEGMAQMLQMKPLDLAALQKEMPADSVMVQYIPTAKKLFIQVVGRDERDVREVDIDAGGLFAEARLTRGRLQAVAAALRQGRGGVSLVKAEPGLFDGATTAKDQDRQLYDGLNQLYKELVLPVEDLLGGYKHVYFVPSGPLAEVPFASLVSQRGDKNHFLVEDHAIGLMPSLYLVHIYLTHIASASDQMLILGDPDGSLPGARKEAEEIRDRVKMLTELRLGEKADYGTFAELGPRSRAVHLATHALLDPVHPEDSYLLLSDNRKLKLIDIQLMNFSDTDLVFLSACETGLGGQGVEFQTLSRAFAHAGVPTVAATLWQVNDAATQDLASRFYDHYDDDALEAMAAAQREMIKEGTYAHPAAWAGFEIMGMP
ncbi:CHAT domain-containing protein [Mesorhizobium comanense]|uniref:CHAT domain-containing protein n=1 Tax=Mesorhizobium comanense TaxID=2502215 RepID=UPI0010F9DB63|nr:CHAT domain-containing protein [Mesorhizobium comanense]